MRRQIPKARLPGLLAEFKQAMLEIGFIYPEKVDAPT